MVICTVLICFNLSGQKKKEKKIDNGHCLYDVESYINSNLSENKKIAGLLKSHTKEYTGNHIIYSYDEIGRDAFGNLVVKVGSVDFGIKRKSDSLCTIKQLLIVRKYQGGGKWGSPYLMSFLQLPEVVNGTYQTRTPPGFGLFAKEYKSCACLEKTKNWLEGGVASSSGSSDSEVNRVKDVVANTNVSNGPFEEKGADGIVYKTGQYDNGKKVGVWTYYGKGGKSTGMVEREENYKDGKLDGVVKTFDESGSVTMTAEYKEGKYNGKTKYYKKGVITMQEEMVNGERNGKMIEYENGKKWKETDYVDAKINGQQITYYVENGKVSRITNYKDDKQNGSYKNFNKDGSVYEEGAFKDGYKDGEWKKYDAKGKVTEKIFYVKGEVEK